SARFSAMAASSAGFRSLTLNFPNGGTPPHGPCQGASSGFIAAVVSFLAAALESVLAEFVAQPPSATSRSPAISPRRRTIMGHLGTVQGSRVPLFYGAGAPSLHDRCVYVHVFARSPSGPRWGLTTQKRCPVGASMTHQRLT